MTGKLIGIARALEPRQPLVETDHAKVTVERGIIGDARGIKRGRQVTILFRDGWDDACRQVGEALPWITRRANLFVEGFERPRRVGDAIRIGEVVLKVAEETEPCFLMERAHSGLKDALTPDWRAGVCCCVVSGGAIRVGDPVEYVKVAAPLTRSLP
jgi:MOSC domain-containing protein YiiM